MIESIQEILEQRLTPEQRAAATDQSTEVLALACAGSGKSRTLAYRIAWLLGQEEDASTIVAFTFTEKAAESMKLQVSRALETCGMSPTLVGAMYIGTIHSYCQNVLQQMDARYRQFDVLDANRLKLYLISRYPQLGLHRNRSTHSARYFDTIREVADAWSILNDELLSIEDVRTQDPEMADALNSVRTRLDADEYIDFSMMVRIVADALAANDGRAIAAVRDVRHLMVDEYQDVNPAQELLITEMHRLGASLFVVGDDDQAIYAWRGADVTNIRDFTTRYLGSSEHTLSFNFRSTPAIVHAADQLAAAELGATRIEKDPDADHGDGPAEFCNLWFESRDAEAEWVVERIQSLLGTRFVERSGEERGLTPGDFAILMRSTRTEERDGSPRHLAFTSRLEAAGVLYSLEAGGGVLDRPEVQALKLSFDLLRSGQPDRQSVRNHFDTQVRPQFASADFTRFTQVIAEWGRLVHAPISDTRRRVFPQQLVHDLLHSFGVAEAGFDDATMRDLGVFSRIIQDVETVYFSIDSDRRFQEILNFLEHVADAGYDTSTEDVIRRPDAVTVSTVHKVKGLEFPVVFVVDVEQGRFPGRQHQYRGWLPPAAIAPALNRGAYRSSHEEETRLFYTALTRAERFLYVTGCRSLPGGVRDWRPSVFAQRLTASGVSDQPSGAAFESRLPQPRVDETVVPTSFSDIRYYLRCPRDYQFRKSFGFSPPITEMFGFGMTVHTAIGKIHSEFDAAPSPDDAAEVAGEVFHLKHVPASSDPDNRPGAYENALESARRMARDYVSEYTSDFDRARQVEVRFEIPVEQAVITGSIDLLLRLDAEGGILSASVVDFKAMEGGDAPEEEERLDWTELSLQVQLYARAATDVLGENAQTGSVHLLKDNRRVEVPVDEHALDSAIENVEWAVDRILDSDFPMRPHQAKCDNCDFKSLCPRLAEPFHVSDQPPEIHTPGGRRSARAFSEYEGG